MFSKQQFVHSEKLFAFNQIYIPVNVRRSLRAWTRHSAAEKVYTTQLAGRKEWAEVE